MPESMSEHDAQLIALTLKEAAARVKNLYWPMGDPGYCEAINDAANAVLAPININRGDANA